MNGRIGLFGISGVLLAVLFSASGGCGSGGSDTTTVSGTASFLNGPTPTGYKVVRWPFKTIFIGYTR